MRVVHCNTIEYAAAWDQQKLYFEQLLSEPELSEEVIMMCEHPHVYTLGKSGHENNLLVDADFLKKIEATYFRTDRGGDITYHGYGQLVVYPILNLDRHGISLREYIRRLEQAIIETVAHYGITAGRIDGATGVWIEGDRKIAAIGVKASRGVTMHGAALNVNTDLKYFDYINPCGFRDKGVTSIEREIGHRVDMEEVIEMFEINFLQNIK